MSFIDKALEVIEKGFTTSEEAVHEFNVHRHTAQLLLQLGVAVYAEQRLEGTHEPVERILKVIDGYTTENGAVDLGELKAAHEVLSATFIAKHSAEPANAGSPHAPRHDRRPFRPGRTERSGSRRSTGSPPALRACSCSPRPGP